MTFLDTILDFVFPNHCLSCKKAGLPICNRCLSYIPEADIPEDNFITAIFSYREKSIKKAIWLLKYRGKRDIAKILAGPIYERILEEMPDLKTFDNFIDPIIIPAPISPKRLRERGFNQAEDLAREVGKLLDIPVIVNILIKTAETLPQAKIKNRTERMKNLKDCFEIKDTETILDRNIIIIDDVTTTGATIKEMKKVLEKSGAKKVIAFTIAH